MSATFINVESIDQLDSLFALSRTEPVVLFKHSATCGISQDVRHQVETINSDVHIVTVQYGRQISDAIEARTGIRHASPQAFVIVDGKVVYHASHYGIDPSRIAEFI